MLQGTHANSRNQALPALLIHWMQDHQACRRSPKGSARSARTESGSLLHPAPASLMVNAQLCATTVDAMCCGSYESKTTTSRDQRRPSSESGSTRAVRMQAPTTTEGKGLGPSWVRVEPKKIADFRAFIQSVRSRDGELQSVQGNACRAWHHTSIPAM